MGGRSFAGESCEVIENGFENIFHVAEMPWSPAMRSITDKYEMLSTDRF